MILPWFLKLPAASFPWKYLYIYTPIVFQNPPNTLWGSVFGFPKGWTSGGVKVAPKTYSQVISKTRGLDIFSIKKKLTDLTLPETKIAPKNAGVQ